MNKSNFIYTKREKSSRYILFLFLITITSGTYFFSLKSNTPYVDDISNINENDTPFIKAIKSEDINKVKSLIKSRINVNEVYENGYTALMVAASKGNVEIVKLLIETGADLESYDNNGNTSFMHAFFNHQKEAVVKFLLTKNVNIEVVNDQEQTPLILAALNNHYKSIELLIKSKAKIEFKGQLERTALMHAVNNNCIEAVKLLIKNKADIETRDAFTFTPLMLAVFNNSGSMIKILLQAGSDRNACTNITISVGKNNFFFDDRITISVGRRDFPNSFYKEMDPIPLGSKALDIAKRFECRLAEKILNNN